jgi:hypothetical protein
MAMPEDGEFEIEYTQYTVEIFDGGVLPVMSLTTFGGWQIEGDFICVYDASGMKCAYRIPKCSTIVSKVYVPKRKNEDEPIATDGDDWEGKEMTEEAIDA